MSLPLEDFKKAVKINTTIGWLEKSLRVASERLPETFVFEGNTDMCAATVKRMVMEDLTKQIDEARKDLVTILAGL